MLGLGTAVSLANLGSRMLGWLSGWLKRTPSSSPMVKIPGKSLILLDSPYNNQIMWSMGSIAGKPAMQVMGRVRVTNKTKYHIHPTLKWKKPIQFPIITVENLSFKSLGEVIPATSTVEVNFTFAIEPPLKEKGEVFVTKVALVDQFGKEYWTRRMEFPYRG